MLFVAVLKLELALKFTAVAEKLAVPAPLTAEPALKLNVPPLNASVAPEAALKPAASVPPPEKFSVPAFTATVPPVLLLNATLTVLLVAPVTCWNVPALLNVGAAPPPNKIPWPLPATKLQVAPARLFTTAPFSRNKLLPPTVVLPNVVAPETFSVRVSRITEAAGRLIPPLAFVVPVPLCVPPPDQVNSPVMTKIPVPVSVPPL